MIQALIFDCFGVLIESMHRRRIADLEASDSTKAQQVYDIQRATDRGMISVDESVEALADIFGISKEAVHEERYQQRARNEELIEFIQSLKSHYRLAMLSNVSGREQLNDMFLPGELDELFEVVVASGDVGMAKPDTEIYELTATRLGVVPEECVMIDDREEFCAGADSAGMQTVHFRTTKRAIEEITLLIDRGEKRH